MTEEQTLPGGVANAGKVVLIGDVVHRPAAANQEAIDSFLNALRATGFDGVPEPLGRDAQGRTMLAFIPGEVAYPPYPAWSLGDDALASAARLLHRYHEAATEVGVLGDDWSPELADPRGGAIVCHNDICPENVVFRDGEAVALLDFDFAAPGNPLWDVAATTRMWGRIGDPVGGRSDGAALDLARVGTFTAAYGVRPSEAAALYETFLARDTVGMAFVQSHVDAGEPAFIEMWTAALGRAKRLAERAWLEANRDLLIGVIG